MRDWFSDSSGDEHAFPEVAVIVVTHNSAGSVAAALSAIPGATQRAHEVIVIDTASGDDTLALARRVAPSAAVVPLDVNVGFARACNLAAARATGRHLLFLNPDTVLDPGAIDVALDGLTNDSSIGIVGGRTRYDDGDLNPTCCFAEPSLWSAFCYATGAASLFRRSSWLNPEAMGGWDRDDDRDVDVVTGCFLLMRTDLFRSLGGFDERFFLYSEDTDLCRRVRDTGLRCVHLAGAGLVHAGGGSDVVRSEKLAKVFRARRQYYAKHWSPTAARLGGGAIDLAVLARRAASAPFPGRRSKWRDVWESRALWHDLDSDPFRSQEPSVLPAEPRHASERDAAVALPVQAEPGPLSPATTLLRHPVETRARMLFRLGRHVVRSARRGDRDFVVQGLESIAEIPVLTVGDLMGDDRHECNVCGWTGSAFYPNTGPGYHEQGVTCPGCSSLDRHRSLLALLLSETDTFTPGTKVVEVAPMRGFEALMRRQPGMDYTSFDLERHAMEQGDITAMRWADGEVDVFLCFHVLEHIPDEQAALREIHRILRPGGVAVIQVPVDWTAPETVEYGAPDPRDVGHVRRYGRDFLEHLRTAGLDPRPVSVLDVFCPEVAARYGMSAEPVVFARRPADG
jgi:N-acetylglucosaminyl-diphospho-decaprenol L-rhamnosyltransferase